MHISLSLSAPSRPEVELALNIANRANITHNSVNGLLTIDSKAAANKGQELKVATSTPAEANMTDITPNIKYGFFNLSFILITPYSKFMKKLRIAVNIAIPIDIQTLLFVLFLSFILSLVNASILSTLSSK